MVGGPTASSSSTAPKPGSPLKRGSTRRKTSKDRGGLIRAVDSGEVPGWTFEEEGTWQGGMFFIQMADTQVVVHNSCFTSLNWF